PSIEGNPTGDLAVHFIDVGQGDCIIIQLPDGKNAIIDAGGDAKNTTGQKCEQRILENIEGLSIKTFEYMFLTHSDADHVDYMDTVLERYDVKNIYRPAFNSTLERDKGINPQYGVIETVTYNNFVKAVQNEQAEIGAKVEFNIGKKEIVGEGYRFDIYGVDEEWYRKDKVGTGSGIDAKEKNKVSPMVLLSYKTEQDTRRVMFTGDSEGKGGNGGEELFLNKYNDNIDIDLLKVGHHGSASSASEEFLQRLDPEYAVISVGVTNNHGHPNLSCLNRLESYKDGNGQNGIVVYMTKYSGDIIFRVNKQGVMSFHPDIEVAA
ncbi:MAG: MBL fold metallo-hydrolase, partial [Clostridia bacterium]|nr:MBL fold metallo-hydrolase [Clostridia bacterium]